MAGTSCQHPARVIGSLGWHKLYWSVYRVLGIEDGHWTVFTLHTRIRSLTKTHLLDCPKTKQQQRDNVLKQQQQFHHGHVGQPLQDGENSLEVVADSVVGHAVVVHDLDSTQLVV